MLRLLYVLILGLVGAGIVHISILFMLPSYSERDVWSKLSAVAAPYTVVKLGPDIMDGSAVAAANPLLLAAACRFDLAEAPVRVQSEGSVPFWSLSIYDNNGLNNFSITDRTSNDRALDFIALSPAQMQEIRGRVPEEFDRSVFVESGLEEGVVLVRVFLSDDTWQGAVDAFLRNLSCRPLDLS